MSYDNPNFEVSLPNGMYTVKLLTIGTAEPIQTFIIGKDVNTVYKNLSSLPR
jgi:hypothetical protein